MTRRYYPNLQTESLDGRFHFSARSPDNEEPDRAFQGDFQYCLAHEGEEVWGSVQKRLEPSPTYLHVGNNGYTVVHTDADDSVELVCRNPSGIVTGCLRMVPGQGESNSEEFRDSHIICSTGGPWFAGDCLGYFFDAGEPLFGLHFSWFRRLLIALERGVFVSGEPPLTKLAVERELEVSLSIVANELNKDPKNREGRFGGAMECLLHHRPAGAFELFSLTEREEMTSEWAGSSYTLDFWLCGPLGKRARIALALRLCGRRPSGLPGTAFFESFDEPLNDGWPSEMPDRDNRWDTLPNIPTARKVIHHLGAPDRIEPFSRKTEKQYEWGDRWSYFRGLGKNTEEVIFSWRPESRGEELESLLVQPVDQVYSPRF